MHAYVGGWPSFPAGVPSGVAIRTQTIGCCKFRTAVWGSDSSLSRSSLAAPFRRDERGTKIHFGFEGLGPADAALADSIMRTVWQSAKK